MKLAELEIAIRKEFPGFLIKKKTDSRMMRAIDLFLKIITFGQMKKFMSSFITTVGEVVYVPDNWDGKTEQNRMIVLRHERIHMRQAKRYTRPLFSFLYLFFPLPTVFAYFRMRLEREAYEESMRATVEYYGLEILKDPEYKRKVLGHFTSAEYFWSWPWRSGLERWYEEMVKKIEASNLRVA